MRIAACQQRDQSVSSAAAAQILLLVLRFLSSRFPPGEFLLPNPRAEEVSFKSTVVEVV